MFENIYSDAFDGDFSDGYISNTNFINCANDAIDISGSNVTIDSVFIQNSGDKGISVGEKSMVDVRDVVIRNVTNAIVAKDFPLVQGTIMFVAGAYILVNLLVEVIYTYLDPRIRYS